MRPVQVVRRGDAEGVEAFAIQHIVEAGVGSGHLRICLPHGAHALCVRVTDDETPHIGTGGVPPDMMAS